MLDSYKHKGLRAQLVKLLRSKEIRDEAVLEAIGKVPRHLFVESAFAEAAYEDRALPIGEGQTISQPYTVARQSELMQLKPGMKVLEIGTGSGYQCSILCEMGMKVFSIERVRLHHLSAKAILDELDYRPRLKWGDGSAGWATYAPFDRIVVTAASPGIPLPLKEQLAIGGRLIIPFGTREGQEMAEITRLSKNEFKQELHGKFHFVPMIGKHGWEE